MVYYGRFPNSEFKLDFTVNTIEHGLKWTSFYLRNNPRKEVLDLCNTKAQILIGY